MYPLTNTAWRSTFDLRCIDLNGSDRASFEANLPVACTKPSNLHHYIIVRRDLPVGAQLAQACHAAGESPGPRPAPGTTVVVLHAADEHHLRLIQDRLLKAGLAFGTVIECDDDEDYPGQLMSIGLAPVTDRSAVRKVLSSLPLAK